MFERDKQFEKFEREQEMIKQMPGHEYVAYFAGIQNRAVLTELRIIKWLLISILVMMCVFADHLLPAGWWHKNWW